MTAEDSKRIRAVFRHFGIPDAEHDEIIKNTIRTVRGKRAKVKGGYRLMVPMSAVRTYNLIFASFTDREIARASGRKS